MLCNMNYTELQVIYNSKFQPTNQLIKKDQSSDYQRRGWKGEELDAGDQKYNFSYKINKYQDVI